MLKPPIALAGLAATACYLSAPLQAGDTSFIEEVLVVESATRTPREINAIVASVQVIQAADIKRLGAQTLKEVFENTPGLIMQYGTFPAASSASKSSVSLRGMGATGTLWLLDGRRLAGEVKNPYDMDRIPASMIERIEVIKGPMSALYGADAVGGVVNIITREPEPGLQGGLGMRYGANHDGEGDESNINGNISGGSDNVLFSLYASYLETEPYTETEHTQTRLPLPAPPPPLQGVKDSYAVPVHYREESEVTTVGGRIEFLASDRLTLGTEFNWFEEEREGIYRAAFHPTGVSFLPGMFIPAFDVPVRSQDDNERLDIAADLRYLFTDSLAVNLRAYRSDYEKRNITSVSEYQDFACPSEEASSLTGLNADVLIESIEALVKWTPVERHLFTFGGELRNEERDATAFSQSNDMETREVESQALFLQDEWAVTDALDITAGLRYDNYEQQAYVDSLGHRHGAESDSETTFRIGAVNRFNQAFALRANFAQGYRVPDVREQFIQKRTPTGYQLGAQAIESLYGKAPHALDPETSDTFELAARGTLERLSYEATLFYNDIENLIQMVAVDASGNGRDDYFTFFNVNDATTYGLEASLKYALTDTAKMVLSWTELSTENDDTGEDLEFNPERMIALRTDWQALPRLTLGASIIYTGEQFYVADNQAQTADDYTLVNLNLGYSLGAEKTWEIYAGANNIFDEEVDKRLGSNPGPFLFLGLRGRF